MCVAMRSGDGMGDHVDWARIASVSESKVADEFDDSSCRFERIMCRFQHGLTSCASSHDCRCVLS